MNRNLNIRISEIERKAINHAVAEGLARDVSDFCKSAIRDRLLNLEPLREQILKVERNLQVA